MSLTRYCDSVPRHFTGNVVHVCNLVTSRRHRHLCKEVLFEDIHEPAEIIHFDHLDCYYDTKCVTSTDPF